MKIKVTTDTLKAFWFMYLATHLLFFIFSAKSGSYFIDSYEGSIFGGKFLSLSRNDKIEQLFSINNYGIPHFTFWVIIPYFILKSLSTFKGLSMTGFSEKYIIDFINKVNNKLKP